MTSYAGYSSLSGNTNWEAEGLNFNNQVWTDITMPEDGDIFELHCYFAGDGVSLPARLCLWDGAGNLQRQTSTFTQPSGGRYVNGQSWATKSITSYHASAGALLRVGFWRDPNVWHVMSFGGSNTHGLKTSTGGPSNLSGASGESGHPAFYIGYTPSPSGPPPGGVKVYASGGWIKRPVKAYVNGGWHQYQLKTWDGSKWVRRA